MQSTKAVAQVFEQDMAGDMKVVAFKQSYKIAPYVYAFCAGPYTFFERKTEGYPPMRIYARKTLLQDVNYEEMFTVTQAGIKFFSSFFGMPYPFNKYD